jgi:hypothetical protein
MRRIAVVVRGARGALRLPARRCRLRTMVCIYMRVYGTQPMPELMRLIQSIEAAGFDRRA